MPFKTSFSIMLVAVACTTLGGLSAARADSPLAGSMKKIDGTPVDLSAYKGKVVLIVNVASRCGYTGQYAGLQKLYDTYGSCD